MDTLKRLPLHPFLVGAYAVLALLSNNITQIKFTDGLRALVVSLLLTLGLWLVLRPISGSRLRAAIVSTLLLVLIFSYGHVYGYLEKHALAGIYLGRHRLLAPLWVILAVLAIWWGQKMLRDLQQGTLAFNVIFLFALVFPVVQIVSYGIRFATSTSVASPFAADIESLHLPENQPPPDIYFIILDGYTRDDYLHNVFDLDNRSFIEELTNMGFYVAQCSQSNYAQTELSLSSTLNMDYLESLVGRLDSQSDDRSRLYPLVKHSLTRQALERLGYKVVAFDSDFYRTQWDDVDVYLSLRADAIGGVNGFEVLLIKTSAGLLLTDAAEVLPKLFSADVERQKQQRHREKILYTLDELATIPESIPGPKFVFVHILAPHDPFVFSSGGEPVYYPEPLDEEAEINGYRGQVAFLNKRMALLLRELIARSAQPPVILLEGDHGAGWASLDGRMANLNAYYLPGDAAGSLYPTITPVNSFRLVFNTYFGGSFDLLEDHSYFSTYDLPYDFTAIPVSTSNCIP